ncbi:MerR family transcriptional regulator [Pantoea sp. LMR881]|nr:MerR family transcriptional regulator [Pantoea sp. LMR881]MCZ4060899.1 MerR family transcriptional regulator [Pantoea sp. LMR881]
MLPEPLKCWQSASFIPPPSAEGYNDSQVSEIRVIRALTSSGDTLSEISTLLNQSWQYRPSGWELRRQEFIIHLHYGTDETRARYLWELYTSYSPDDILAVAGSACPVAE